MRIKRLRIGLIEPNINPCVTSAPISCAHGRDMINDFHLKAVY
jgi:hypothetical protein